MPAQPCSLSHHVWTINILLVNSIDHDPSLVVQSVISLASSLRVILLTILADSIYNILIFFAEKM